MPEFTGHRDIRSYIRTIWRWKLLVLVLVVGAPVVAYFVEHRKPSTYSATATVAFTQDTSSTSSSVSIPTGGSIYTTGNIQAIARLITTPSVAQVAGQLLTPKVSGSSILGGVSASADVSTNFITISVSSGSPVRAADVANAFGKALNVSEDSDTKASLDSAIKSYQSELKSLPRSNSNYATIEQELLADKTAVKTPPNGFTLVDPATPNYTPTGPHPRRAAELGLVVGILLAFGAIMMLDSLDRHVRTPDDLEQFTKLPILGAIAPSAFRGDMETTPVDDEAFQTLRTSLTYFTVDEKINSVLITSPGEQEGKSTIAARLAGACAHAGLDVVLVDADLRRAGATSKLGIKTDIGLGLVLAEQRPVETALHEWPVAAESTGRLRVLPAGPPPPNPAALISSQSMRELIRVLEHQSDLVIIDSPAALAVSDAVPLMQTVSGVVLVARMHRSKRDTLRRLRKIIDSAHGRLLGAVATGVTSGPGYEKYSQAYYAPIDHSNKRGGGRKRRKQGGEPPQASSNGTQASANGNGSNVADHTPTVRD
jgi:capsular exopolysaccharide synthesis family protein